jgi:hypothetical protein
MVTTASTRRQFLSLLGLSAVAVGCGTTAGASSGKGGTKTLRYQGWAGQVTLPELAEGLGYLGDVKLEWVGNTISGPQDIQSAATGQIDFGGAFNGAVVKLAANKAPIKAVISYYGADKYAYNGFYVLKDSPLHSARDLIGKKIGMNTLGAHSEAMLDIHLQRGSCPSRTSARQSPWSSRRSTPSRPCARSRSTWPYSAASCATRPSSSATSTSTTPASSASPPSSANSPPQHPTVPSVEGQPQILPVDGDEGIRADQWHTDVTFERGLFIGGFAQSIVGLGPSDSRDLLRLFQAYVTRPENIVRVAWTPGDVVLFDNMTRLTEPATPAPSGCRPTAWHPCGCPSSRSEAESSRVELMGCSPLDGLFPTTSLPATDTGHEAELRERMRAVLEHGEEPDARLAAIIALISASGTLPSLDPVPKWSGTVATRAKELEQGNWGAAAVNSAVTQIAASFSAASAAAVVTTLS